MLEEYAGSVPVPSSFSRLPLSGSTVLHRTRALAELALARFRLNDMAGVAECAARIHQAADHNDPEQRMLSVFTRGVAATLGGDLAAGRVLLARRHRQISVPPLRDDPRSLLFLGLAGRIPG